jgi:hypothetical protein
LFFCLNPFFPFLVWACHIPTNAWETRAVSVPDR